MRELSVGERGIWGNFRSYSGSMSPHAETSPAPKKVGIREFLGVFRYSKRAVAIVWSTHRTLTLALGAFTLVAGLLPAAVAYLGQLIVDSVILASSQSDPSVDQVYLWVGLEAAVVIALVGAQRAISVCQSLLRALLGHRVNVMILEKALTLGLADFEDSEFYDKLTRARREASSRPLSLVMRTFGLIQNGISLVSYAALLLGFSPWAVLVLLLGSVPAFLGETKFAGDAFRLFRWRSPDTRKQMYLEMLIAREDYAKEVKIFSLGPLLLKRYAAIFTKLFAEDRSLTLRRGVWGYLLGLITTLAFYGAYGWIAMSAAYGRMSVGEMTMYLLVFKQGQSAVSAILLAVGGMYEDNLYLSNLYEYLDQESESGGGTQRLGPSPGSGIVFEKVSFRYPGATTDALNEVSFSLQPGSSLALVGENGSGKTTLIKLLSRLYRPNSGVITIDGLDLQDWEEEALRKRLSVAFQDFARYQLLVGENLGAGDVDHFDDEERWADAAEQGMAAPFINEFPEGYHTQLGRWFKNGRELSGGQWQKIALSRAFMRKGADILVLDEPTAAMDAEAEAKVFEHVRNMASEQMVILISHRFSTVRSADRILVFDAGKIVEEGTHEQLMGQQGRYAKLFTLQAEGYR